MNSKKNERHWKRYAKAETGVFLVLLQVACDHCPGGDHYDRQFCKTAYRPEGSRFYAVMLNASLLDQMTSEQPDFVTDFAEKEGIDLNTSDITFDTSIRIVEDSMDETSITSSQKLMVYVAANELDCMITDFTSFQKYANSSMFHDLRDILTDEQIQALEPYFYYVDREVVLAIEAANDDMNTDYTPDYPDPLHPEDMQDPVPVGICLTDCKDLTDTYYFRGDGIVMGIYANAEHVQTAVDLAEYLLNK